MIDKFLVMGLGLAACTLEAQQSDRVDLGQLSTGASVSFQHESTGGWGMEISGGAAPRLSQPQPARLEVYHSDQDIRQLTAGYQTVKKAGSGADGNAEITDGGVTFRVL